MQQARARNQTGAVLVLGGARSGKSRFALELAAATPAPRVFVATAEALDEEMAARIARHRAERPGGWATVEEPLLLPERLPVIARDHRVVLVDCLTLWVANLLRADAAATEGRCEALLAAIAETRGSRLLLVANEVGMGIVPDSALAREFRDVAGRLNQRVAAAAAEVYLVAAGLPLRMK